MVSLSVMGIGARAYEKFFRAPKLRRMLLLHELINFPPNYVMIPICYRNSRTVPRQRKFNRFLRWGIIHRYPMPIISFMASESCLSNLQNSATLSRASERACFSLSEASLSRTKKKFSST